MKSFFVKQIFFCLFLTIKFVKPSFDTVTPYVLKFKEGILLARASADKKRIVRGVFSNGLSHDCPYLRATVLFSDGVQAFMVRSFGEKQWIYWQNKLGDSSSCIEIRSIELEPVYPFANREE